MRAVVTDGAGFTGAILCTSLAASDAVKCRAARTAQPER
jgi:hypothetical protein